MNWHLYKKDDPNTWPQIDCPMIVYFDGKIMSCVYSWDNNKHCFIDDRNIGNWSFEECYYSRIAYVPSGYKTHDTIKCGDDSRLRCSGEDDGYCMYDHFECQQQRKVNEYEIEMKRIWREFP